MQYNFNKDIFSESEHPVTAHSLEKMIEEISKLEKPKALLLMPSPTGFEVYELSAEEGQACLTTCSILRKHPEAAGGPGKQ